MTPPSVIARSSSDEAIPCPTEIATLPPSLRSGLRLTAMTGKEGLAMTKKGARNDKKGARNDTPLCHCEEQ